MRRLLVCGAWVRYALFAKRSCFWLWFALIETILASAWFLPRYVRGAASLRWNSGSVDVPKMRTVACMILCDIRGVRYRKSLVRRAEYRANNRSLLDDAEQTLPMRRWRIFCITLIGVPGSGSLPAVYAA
jgi:hypothetical protein